MPAKQLRGRKYWLFKSEPDDFSIDDLERCAKRTTCWDGVRNYQARNFIRDEMRLGDGLLFYHSSCDLPAIMGTAEIVREAYPDHTAFDPNHKHHDPKASPDNPVWQMVDIRLVQKFSQPVTLESLRGLPALAGMELLRKGSRLSVQPVRKSEADCILKLAR